MSRREPFSCQRDRATFYGKLINLGFSPDRANDIALKLSKDVFSYRQNKIYNASGRVLVELPADPQGAAEPGDRAAEKIARTKDRLLELVTG